VTVALIWGEWNGIVPDEDARGMFDAVRASPIKRDIETGEAIHPERVRGSVSGNQHASARRRIPASG
jgi:hypothetical protein